MSLNCGAVYGGGVHIQQEGTMLLAWLSASFPSLPLLQGPSSRVGPSGADSPGGWVCGHFRTPWVSTMNSPVRLGVSPATATPPSPDFLVRGFEAFFPRTGTLGCAVCLPPNLSSSKCGTSQSSSRHLAVSPLHPGCPPPPLLPVWRNVSSLTPWLLDFHTVWFSGSSGRFLFWNLLLSFFWLCEEAKSIYLCLHLGWKSLP